MRRIILFMLLYICIGLGAQTTPQVVFSRSYADGERAVEACAVELAPEGGFAVLGTSRLAGTAARALLILLDAQGNELWRVSHDLASETGWAAGLAAAPTGGWLVLCRDATHTAILPVDAAGNVHSVEHIGPADITRPYAITATPQGCVVAGAYGEEGWMIHLASDFSVIWEHRQNVAPHVQITAVQRQEDGSFFALGLWEDIFYREQSLIERVDADGNQLLCGFYSSDYNDRFYDIAETLRGYFVVGHTEYVPPGYKGWCMCINELGDYYWDVRYTYYDELFVRRIMPVTEEMSYLYGFTTDADVTDLWLAQIDDFSVVEWEEVYHYAPHATAVDSRLLSENSLVLLSTQYDQSWQHATMGLLYLEVPTNAHSAAPAATTQLWNYPNPFNPSTEICFSYEQQDAQAKQASVDIFNAKGQLVIRLPLSTDQLDAGSVTWQGNDCHGRAVPSGVYLYRLQVDGQIRAARKCMLMK